LKPGNVLLDKNFNCKISDFGVSTKTTKKKKASDDEVIGSIMYDIILLCMI
jgi:serine/threonine protein kinase